MKAYLQAEYPAYNVSGNLYFGYMDMTYFSFFPHSLKQRNLKTGIVFIHESCQFEIGAVKFIDDVEVFLKAYPA